ncbi:unnamed protein product (macronuclear) [Paramecium tetraurelia]|uniref:t-SNARE coiled-coil homology domain-containing protein n=1 Tax=Paramecium tetraurelia TaxID=5888 RepID=A0BLA5_PARTE|nr:uncharacterized protein GSPATT00029954001 [Paramecium tetraurelia]CAK59322.1 unnamed protein product [Paramecium tetraurelia]|eukprot:XP_001426720.1 hypothetical protein (macronuclear) [Paramecium tetraurelia strain d4-2]
MFSLTFKSIIKLNVRLQGFIFNQVCPYRDKKREGQPGGILIGIHKQFHFRDITNFFIDGETNDQYASGLLIIHIVNQIVQLIYSKIRRIMKFLICIQKVWKPKFLKGLMIMKILFDFLNCLEFYLQEKLDQEGSISNIQVDQDFLIQQIKQIYLEDGSEIDYVEESKEQFKVPLYKQRRMENQIGSSFYYNLDFIQLFFRQSCFFLLESSNLIVSSRKRYKSSKPFKKLKIDWQSQHDRIAGKMQEMLSRIDELQEQISHEANLNKRDIYLKELDETTQQLDQQIENISEMGQQLQIDN